MKRRLRAWAALLAMVILSGMLTLGASAANDLPYAIQVNRKMNTVTVYTQDEAGNYTVPYKAMICSTGRLGHATPLGNYAVTSVKKEWCMMFVWAVFHAVFRKLSLPLYLLHRARPLDDARAGV